MQVIRNGFFIKENAALPPLETSALSRSEVVLSHKVAGVNSLPVHAAVLVQTQTVSAQVGMEPPSNA